MDIVTGIGIIGTVVATVDCLKDINPLYRRKKAEMDVYIDIYKNQLKTSLNEIPEKNRQEPKNSIIWPALESSIFYLEDEEYRKMFAKLITSACDNRKNKNMHICFIELIKQMESDEAIILQSFHHTCNKGIVNIDYVYPDKNSRRTYMQNVFLFNQEEPLSMHCASIANLYRLGLITIEYTSVLLDDKYYLHYSNHPTYLKTKASLKEKHLKTGNPICDIEIQKGIVSLTPLGENFIKVCIK